MRNRDDLRFIPRRPRPASCLDVLVGFAIGLVLNLAVIAAVVVLVVWLLRRLEVLA